MRKELCRNFQKGSCRYGEACRYLHPAQAKPNNPFGFGSQSSNQQQPQQQQQQQHKSSNNPFGFGVQGGGGNRSNQFQPFDNKWTRTASTADGGGGGATTQQTSKQPVDHKCTDPAACTRIMQEDFKNERPMWKLTCYSHWKNYPCDISGDISYEELRAMAYEEAKRGIPLQSIVERERNLQNSKIAEFENFLRNPYRGSVTANQSPFTATTPSIFPPTNQINSSPAFSGFNQQPAFPNTSPGGVSSSGPPNPFGKYQQVNAFSANTPQPVPSGPVGFQNQPSVTFKPASFGPGPGFATAQQKNNSIFPSTTSKPVSFGPGPGFATATQNNNIFPSMTPTPAVNTTQNNQTPFNFNTPVASFTAPVINTTNTSSGNELKIDGAPVDTSIWLKEKWNPGEIPEQAPPDAFV